MLITATTAKMLEMCRTHIAINGEMDAMGLGSSKDVHTVHKGPPKKGQGKGQRQGQGQKQQQQHSCGNCTKHHAPGHSSCPAKDAQMPSMWEDWTLESEVPLQGQTVLLWTTRTSTQQGRQVQTETDPRRWN